MTSSKWLHIGASVAVLGTLAGCQVSYDQVMLSKKSAVELRAMQARAFETGDQKKTLRTVIATLQDLGYSLEKVDASSGTVSATKLAALKLSASAYPHGTTQTIVRANALFRMENAAYEVDDPEFYQKNFFEPLSAAMSLAATVAPGEGETPLSAKQPRERTEATSEPLDAHPGSPQS
jgi:hypothetical protein